MLIAAIAMVVGSAGAAGANESAPEDRSEDHAAAASGSEGDDARADRADEAGPPDDVPSNAERAEDAGPPEQAPKEGAEEDGPPEQAPKERAEEDGPPEQARSDEGRNDRQRGSNFETSEPDETFHAKALDDHECNADEWHFVITQVAEGDYPGAVSVTFEDGSGEAGFDKYTGHTAHYVSKDHLGSMVTGATAELPGDWSGQFNLSHGPCDGGDGGDGGDDVVPELEFTSVTAACVAEAEVIEFRVESDVDRDGVTVSLLDADGETVDTAVVNLSENTDGTGFIAGGDFPYPSGIESGLTVSIGFDGGSATDDVPPAPGCEEAPQEGEGGGDGEVIVVLPETQEPADEGEEPVVVVEGEEMTNIPVIDHQPVRTIVQPRSVASDQGPAVLGSTVNRGQLARTGSGADLVLAPFGLALVLAGFALRRSSRRTLTRSHS